MKRPTIKDIAARAGVSKGAVSLALNGRPGVSDTTRARVLSVAASLGYRPSSTARALSSSSADAVGLVLARPLGAESFFFQLIGGIQAELPMALLLQVVEDHDAEVELYRRWWAEHRVDGVFLVDLRVDDPRVGLVEELGLPAVVIGGAGHHGNLTSVWADDAKAMVSIVSHLMSLGHKRIARVAGLPSLLHTARRDAAFRTAVGPSGVIVPADYTDVRGASATRELLSGTSPPTAIVYDNDVMAVAGAVVAAEMGVAVPAELSIVAWDDSPLCRLVHPPLTALSRDTVAFGARAARALLAVITGASPTDTEDATPVLVPRASTGRCR